MAIMLIPCHSTQNITEFPHFYWKKHSTTFPGLSKRFSRTFSETANV